MGWHTEAGERRAPTSWGAALGGACPWQGVPAAAARVAGSSLAAGRNQWDMTFSSRMQWRKWHAAGATHKQVEGEKHVDTRLCLPRRNRTPPGAQHAISPLPYTILALRNPCGCTQLQHPKSPPSICMQDACLPARRGRGPCNTPGHNGDVPSLEDVLDY